MSDFTSKPLPADVDAVAPDGSVIRVLLANRHCSLAHGTLPSGGVSLAVQHRTVEEIWFVLSGRAEIWRRSESGERVELVGPGDSLTIPLGTAFQFRTSGSEPFVFLMATTPPWPDSADEAFPVAGHWSI